MRVSPSIAAAASVVLLTACPQEPPPVSLQEAKRITADFKGASFTPPPRTIDDITAMLDREKPDPAKIGALIRDAAAPVPDGSPSRRFEALVKRSNAAYELGQVPQALADGKEAIRVARENRLDAWDAEAQVRLIYSLTGDFKDLVRITDEIVQSYQFEMRGRLFVAHGGTAYNAAVIGDMDLARRHLRSSETLLSQSANWQAGTAYREFGANWESWNALGGGGVELFSGRYEEGLAIFRRALDFVEQDIRERKPTGSFVSAPILYRGGVIVDALVRLGRLAEAEASAREAVVAGLKQYGRYWPGTPFVMTSLSRVLVEQGRFAEGERLARETVATYEKIGASAASWRAAEARVMLADALGALGRWPEVLGVFGELEAGFAGDPLGRKRFVEHRPTRALALLMTGKAGEAATALRALAERNVADLGANHYHTAEARGLHAVALAEAGQGAAASAEFHAAVPILLQRSREVEQGTAGDAQPIRARRLKFILDGYISLLNGEAGEEAKAEAFRIADIARARSVQDALAASGARAAAREPELADLARREQDARARIGALFGGLTNQLAAPSDQRNPAVIAQLRKQIDDLRAARAALAQEIERRFPAYADLVNPKPATIEQTRAALHPGEALVATYVSAEKTFVWAVPKSGPVAFAAVPLGREALSGAVKELRKALEPNARVLGDIPVFDVGLSHRLFAQLLDPVSAGWKDAKSLLVVADGPLGQLPFSMLVTRVAALPAESDALFSNYRDVPWLVRSHAVTAVPSVASLAGLRKSPGGAPARRSFAGFGDPYFSEAQAGEGAADQASGTLIMRGALDVRGVPVALRAVPRTNEMKSADLSDLPRLPETRDEVTAIALALNADLTRDVFLGERATEGAVKRLDLGGYRVLAFATHGLVPGDLDGLRQPALALTTPKLGDATEDGLLTMGEILGLRLDADWVVLSACNTAAGDGAAAEAFSGLGRAFFYAGTRALLLSNWPVETTSAQAITTDLFRRQAADPSLGRAEALREAMVAAIGEGGLTDRRSGRMIFSYAHPIFWAPFSLVGDGGGAPPGG
jgi:CHAT domain-containing protein